jgi:hypothetical protein
MDLQTMLHKVYPIELMNILGLVALLMLQSCVPSSRLSEPASRQEMKFHTLNGTIPIVKVYVNNQEAWLIVDTGASITLLDASQAERYGFTLVRSNLPDKNNLVGFGGKVKFYQTRSCAIQLGQLHIRLSPRAQDMSELSSVIVEHERIRIIGILGSDILYKYKININYHSRTLSFPIRTAEEDILTGEAVGANF